MNGSSAWSSIMGQIGNGTLSNSEKANVCRTMS